MMEPKDAMTLLGIVLTFAVALPNPIYRVVNNRKTAFVNYSDFFAAEVDRIAARQGIHVHRCDCANTESRDGSERSAGHECLLRKRDTLMHQIILHLNPDDPEDRFTDKKQPAGMKKLSQPRGAPREGPGEG